jgi:hypothetical protein
VVIASDTAPVREVLNDKNGLLVPFFDIEQLANCVIEVLTDPPLFRSIRVQARKTILDQYDLARICLPRMMAFIQKARRFRHGGLDRGGAGSRPVLDADVVGLQRDSVAVIDGRISDRSEGAALSADIQFASTTNGGSNFGRTKPK